MSSRSACSSRRVRLGLATLAGGLLTAGALTGVWSDRAAAAPSPGIGSASAEGFQVTPHEGSLAVGGVFDEALAGHTDRVARAQSQGLDLGAVGAQAKGYNCGQPPTALAQFVPDPLEVETPSDGGTSQATAGPAPSQNNADGSTEHVLANGNPYGEADSVFGGQIAAPNNLISISHVASKAWSGLVSGVREAGATVNIGSVSIAGTVTLAGLHWDVVYPTGSPSARPISSFGIGRATVGGQSIPTADLSAVSSAVNQALGPLGIQIVMPGASFAQGTQFESPLQIEVVPSDTRDSLLDPVVANGVEKNFYPIANGLENGFANTSPPYNSLAPVEQGSANSPGQQLEAALCQTDTPITVADITVASFTAGGYFNIGLGGVNATSGDLPTNPFQLGLSMPFSLPGSSQVLPGAAGSAAVPAVAGSPGSSGSPGSPTGSGPQGGNDAASSGNGAPTAAPASSPAASIAKAASGPLLAVGLAALGLLLLLAEADRRMIRRTAHAAVFEE